MPERHGGRPKARDLVMRVLYEADITGDDATEILHYCFGRYRFTQDGRDYAEALTARCVSHHRRIDNALRNHLQNWELGRLGAVERAILRLATAELLFVRDTPAQVILDEALRLAHRYGDPASAAFINGVLDPIAHQQRKSELRGTRRAGSS